MSRNHRETFLYQINRTNYNRSSSNSIAVPAPIRILLSSVFGGRIIFGADAKTVRSLEHHMLCRTCLTVFCLRYKEVILLFFAKIRKPHLFKSFFQSQFLFDLDEIFNNKGRIKSNFTLQFQHCFII